MLFVVGTDVSDYIDDREDIVFLEIDNWNDWWEYETLYYGNELFTAIVENKIIAQPSFSISSPLEIGWHLDQINITGAWEITNGSEDLIIAVIDSGIDFSHPELASASWVNVDEIADNGIDDDSNGYIDDVAGWTLYFIYSGLFFVGLSIAILVSIFSISEKPAFNYLYEEIYNKIIGKYFRELKKNEYFVGAQKQIIFPYR